MSSSQKMLETGIARSRALLPDVPARWSYSSLREMAECPRRYALSRADYPDLWDQPGYPQLPSTATLFGNIVHGALEAVVKAFIVAGVESLKEVKATEVLRQIGGLTAVVEAVTVKQLARAETNPRIGDDRWRRIARELRAQIPEARSQVQMYLSRTAFVPRAVMAAPLPSSAAGPGWRRALGEGTHAEVRLVDDELRLVGRVDLLTIHGKQVEIVDYKTGAESITHQDQVRLYALLWHRDRAANPAGLEVSGLTATYRDHDVVIAVPSAVELETLTETVAAAVELADAELASGEPTPIPSDSTCHFCAVRHLCPPYWRSIVPKPADVKDSAWFDFEGVIGERNGPRSWWARQPGSERPDLLLRTTGTTPPFSEGDHVRLLGVVRDTDREAAIPIASLSGSSEVFFVEH